MSMPSYPPHGADITKDEALTMIIASIAMEELALSHILNAEGEKLQYILGTLPGRHGSCASAQDVLAVNKSITGLLDAVMQNQMLLKNKLEKALEASGHGCEPPAPDAPCPPPCEDNGRCCREKSGIQLAGRCGGFAWNDGCLLPWQVRSQRGERILWRRNTPALVHLDPGRLYALNYTVNVRGPVRGTDPGAVCIKRTPQDAFFDVPPLRFSARDLDGDALTLQYATTLFPRMGASCAAVSLLLDRRDGLYVDRAVLNITEL